MNDISNLRNKAKAQRNSITEAREQKNRQDEAYAKERAMQDLPEVLRAINACIKSGKTCCLLTSTDYRLHYSIFSKDFWRQRHVPDIDSDVFRYELYSHYEAELNRLLGPPFKVKSEMVVTRVRDPDLGIYEDGPTRLSAMIIW